MYGRLVLILLATLVLAALVTIYYTNKSQLESEKFHAGPSDASATGATAASASPAPASSGAAYSSPAPVSAEAAGPRGDVNPGILPRKSVTGGGAGDVMPSESSDMEIYRPVSYPDPTASKTVASCYPKDRLTAEDLLPRDAANTRWSQVNPAGQGDVKDQNFLSAGYLIGINTQGQSLRNPNLQIRSEPPNPQYRVSIWNQTTIEPDLNRRPLELGAC